MFACKDLMTWKKQGRTSTKELALQVRRKLQTKEITLFMQMHRKNTGRKRKKKSPE